MNLLKAKQVMLRTHIAALTEMERAIAIAMEAMPGVGKSEALLQYAEELARYLGKPVGVVQFMLATITSADVRGFMIPMRGTPPKSVFSLPPWYPHDTDVEVDEDGDVLAEPSSINYYVVGPDGHWYKETEWTGGVPEVGILFLDEWGQAEEDVKKPAGELVLNGSVGTTRLPITWRVISAQNRTSDRSGVLREMMHIVNRRLLLKIDSDVATWQQDYVSKLEGNRRLHHLTTSFAEQHTDIVFRTSVPDGSDPFCTPRTLVLMDRTLRALRTDEQKANDDMPTDEIAREVAAGLIGEGAAATYMDHMKYADLLPRPHEIVADPMTAKLPTGSDGLMVAAFMLSGHLQPDYAQPFFTYIMRMPKEPQILAMQIITTDPRRMAMMSRAQGYSKYMADNKEVLFASYA